MKPAAKLTAREADVLAFELDSPAVGSPFSRHELGLYFADALDPERKKEFEDWLTHDDALRSYVEARSRDERGSLVPARIAAWQEPLRDFFVRVSAEMREVLDQIAWVLQHRPAQANVGCAGTGGFATPLKDEIATSDKRLATRMTVAPDQIHMRVLVEIADVALDGACLRLTWKPDGASQPATLKRPSKRATKVKAEFLLTHDEALAARKSGIQARISEQ